MRKYEPIRSLKGFYLEKNEKGSTLIYKKLGSEVIRVLISPGGHIPKTGLYLCKQLKELVRGKSVLDIGTGETAILALFSSVYGAKSVLASEVDNQLVELAEKNVRLNKAENINLVTSDVFSNIAGTFDILVSNPPQLPMLKLRPHDSGGPDGKEVIKRIIEGAPRHLSRKGQLIMLIFDFLGTERSFNDDPPIFERLKQMGFAPRIMAKEKRIIVSTGQTYKALNYIKATFPGYKFNLSREGIPYHYIEVVQAQLR